MRSLVYIGLAALVALVITACSSGSGSPVAPTEGASQAPPAPGSASAPPAGGAGAVAIVDFAFDPVTLTIPVGTTVTWTNTGSVNHTVKWSDGTPESDSLANGATYQRTFDAAGTFAYVCGIHGSMKGTISVTP